MKLTLAITTYNRYEMLLESFAQVIDDPRIDEILICDDHSKDEYWNKIKELPKFNDKIKVVRQLENRGMGRNKHDAVFNSKNDWVLLGDSDNVFGKDYLDAAFKYFELHQPGPDCILCPSFAKPSFDFRKYEEMGFTKFLVKEYIKDPVFNMMMNCCNYIVNREFYLNAWKENKEVRGSDTIWHNYNHLISGGIFCVIPDMHYAHRIHEQSGFLQDCEYNMKMAEETRKLILAL